MLISGQPTARWWTRSTSCRSQKLTAMNNREPTNWVRHLTNMVDDQAINSAAAQMIRIHGRNAALACERMIDKPDTDEIGVWPKVLEAIRRFESQASPQSS